MDLVRRQRHKTFSSSFSRLFGIRHRLLVFLVCFVRLYSGLLDDSDRSEDSDYSGIAAWRSPKSRILLGMDCCFFPHQPKTRKNKNVFFFAGGLAQRNNWMEAIKTKARVVIYLLVICSIGSITVYELFLKPLLSSWAQSLCTGYLEFGMSTMWIGLAVTVFFMVYGDKNYFFTDFFPRACTQHT